MKLEKWKLKRGRRIEGKGKNHNKRVKGGLI